MSSIGQKWIYRVYDSSNNYLGLIKPSSIFSLNQNIATTFAQTTITFPRDTPTALTQPDNFIRIWEYSTYYPEGIKVFDGYISKAKQIYDNNNDAVLTCISNGQDLSQYIVESGDTAYITQATDTGNYFNAGSSGGHDPDHIVMQQFVVSGSTAINGGSVEITTSEAGTLGIILRQQAGGSPNPNSDAILASGSVNIAIPVTKFVQKITFSAPSTLVTSTTYYIEVSWSGNSGNTYAEIFAASGSPYGSGAVYTTQDSSGTSWDASTLQSGYDLYFIMWKHGGSVAATYTQKDPSFMLTDVMNDYISRGGLVATGLYPPSPLFTNPYSDSNFPVAYWGVGYAQTITPATNLTLNIVELFIGYSSGSVGIVLNIYKGSPSSDQVLVIGGSESYVTTNTLVASSNLVTVNNPSEAGTLFEFASPVTLTAGQQYYFEFDLPQGSGSNLLLGGGTTGEASVSPFGQAYYANATFNNSGFTMATNSAHPSMYCQLYYVLPLPTNIGGGYPSTGVTTTYSFKQQTVAQAIAAIVSLAPSDWYWYVDVTDNILIFAEANTQADIILTAGREITDFEPEATRENIVNTVYFNGGDDGTGTSTNILVKVTAALNGNRVGLAVLSDNRVNEAATGSLSAAQAVGRLIAQNYINAHSNLTYLATISLLDAKIDNNLIKLGMILGFQGFGDYRDSLLLQVVGKSKMADYCTYQIGTLPLRSSQAVAQIESQLAYLQTINNTTTPA